MKSTKSKCRSEDWTLIKKVLFRIYDAGTHCLISTNLELSGDTACYIPIVEQATTDLEPLRSKQAACQDISLDVIIDIIKLWLDLSIDERIANVTFFISQPIDERVIDFLLLFQKTDKGDQGSCHTDDALALENLIVGFHEEGKKCLQSDVHGEQAQKRCYERQLLNIGSTLVQFVQTSARHRCADEHFAEIIKMVNKWKQMNKESKLRAIRRFSTQECKKVTVVHVVSI